MDSSNIANKMHLYLKHGNHQRWLVIQLVDGHIPTIAGLSNEKTGMLTECLEPALWFKVMVLESVTIDCDNQILSWTNGDKNPDDGTPLTYCMFGSSTSYYDFDDDIDELFQLAFELIEKNPLAEPDENKRLKEISNFEQTLFRMLHCYIFSKIVLRPKDLPHVEKALKAQTKAISKLEDVTLLHQRLAEYYQSQMMNLREQYIGPNIETLLNKNSISGELIAALLVDLEKSEKRIRREFDEVQKKVDELKMNWQNGKSDSNIVHWLADARRSRDIVHNHLAAALVLKCMLQEHFPITNDTSAVLDDQCKHYLSLYQRVQLEKHTAKLYVDKKLLVLSVRECIQSVIKDLEKGNETSGEELVVDGQRSTDVIAIGRNEPTWQTLTQRLSAIVYDDTQPVGRNFRQFYQKMELDYRQILRTINLLSDDDDKSFLTTIDDFHIVRESDLGYNKLFLDDQRVRILVHLVTATEMISTYFSECNTCMFTRKLRLCYEKCFYNRVGKDLILLYRVVYAKDMHSLETRVLHLKRLEVCKLGLQMRGEWWLKLFEPDSTDISSSVHASSSDSNLNSFNDAYNSDDNQKDNDTFSDYEEDEFCSDREESTQLKHDEFINRIKVGLNRSKNDVLSRSMEILTDNNKNVFEMSCKLLKDDITRSSHVSSLKKQDVLKYLNDDRVKSNPSTIRRCFSSSSVFEPELKDQAGLVTSCDLCKDEDTFDLHFKNVINSLINVFSHPSPLKKMQCLTKVLRLVSSKVEELRLRGKDSSLVDRSKIVVTADDLLPILVLILLQMSPCDIAKFYVELIFISDYMAEFLSSGCHSYALCEFQIAFRVLDQTCDELSI